MSGATPFYGIRYPDGTTKVLNLGTELKQFALDFEAALRRETVFGNDVLADLYAVAQAVNGAVTPTENAMAAALASPSSPARAAAQAITAPRDLGNVNFDAIVLTGRYTAAVQQGTTGPEGTYAGPFYLDVFANPTDGSYVRQMATQFWNGSTFVRVRQGGAWRPWLRMTAAQ